MEVKRKGAKSLKDIPAEVLQQLNLGTIESVNLTEWLAVDQKELLKNVLSEKYATACLSDLEVLEKASTMQTIRRIGETLLRETLQETDKKLLKEL